MSIQDFVTLWQARPFRAFRLRTARGAIEVDYPLQATLTPDEVVLVAGAAGVERLTLADIEGGDPVGPALAPEQVVAAVDPVRLARDASLLSNASAECSAPADEVRRPACDPGRVEFRLSRGPKGERMVNVAVQQRNGTPLFSTDGTRWNVHGTERFENGTSLYLHHLDHPTVEQRVIIWPPDRGTFESFSEALDLAPLRRELEKRDLRLAARPAKESSPPAAWFRQITPDYPRPKVDGRRAAFGSGRDEDDFDRFELRFVTRELADGRTVRNPCVLDVLGEEIVFNLVDTEWDATGKRGDETFALALNHAGVPDVAFALTLDPRRLTARVGGERAAVPLLFLERQLQNFCLHRRGNLLLAALRAGPTRARESALLIPLADGFRAELWPGDVRVPLPFLQPRLLDAHGRTLLDLRATAWAAEVEPWAATPGVTLRLVSHEPTRRRAPLRLELQIDLVARQVTCRGVKGSTSLGMLQALVRHVRGVKWLNEELPAWLAKGRAVPVVA